MVCSPIALVAVNPRTAQQRSRRGRSRQLLLRVAVRRAVDVFFHFSHRGADFKALWSDIERVWLGRATFLDWALADLSIDIPWVVAEALDAPTTVEELSEAVRAELVAYWAIQSARLPRSRKPRWMPLP